MARYGFLSFRSADSNGLYTFPFPFLPAGHPPFSIPAFPPHSAVRPPGELFCCKSNRQSQPLPMPASRRRGEPGKIFLSAVERIFPSSLGRVFLPTFRSRKIIPGGRKQAEQREEK